MGVFESVRGRSCRPRTSSKSTLTGFGGHAARPHASNADFGRRVRPGDEPADHLEPPPEPCGYVGGASTELITRGIRNELPSNRISLVASGKSSSSVNRQPSGLSRPAAPDQASGLAVTIDEDMPLISVMPRVIWAKHLRLSVHHPSL